MPQAHTITLATGKLHINLKPGKIPLRRLLGFAARISSKRKFLLVSKVLGKHYPVSPKLMAWSYRALARQALKCGISSPSLWIGMAETATGLGYGVFAAAYGEGLNNGLFMQTTRYHLAGLQRLAFDEAHSHATDFFLYYPEHEPERLTFLSAQTLVLIDDEISTGRTFLRLINAYQAVNPHLQRVLIVSLVNFASADDRQRVQHRANIAVEWVCLREGGLAFDSAENTALDNITVNVSSNNACKRHLLAWPGRLGICLPITLNQDVLTQLSHICPSLDKAALDNPDPRPVMVLGTGECNAPAFLLGGILTKHGVNVKVQSTTRSPIHIGNDIASVCQFEDNYEDGIANFIYNLVPEQYRQIIICHETPLCPPLLSLLHDWQAISAKFELCQDTHHATLHFFRP